MTKVMTGGPSGRKIPTLDTLSDSQIAAIRSLRGHEDQVVEPLDFKRPVSIFFDQARYDAEQSKVFRALPRPVTVSGMLPEPGSVLAHDSFGVPLLLTRAKDGEVRAFLNACQHKGAKLINTPEPHRANLISCPYHSWGYRLSGELAVVAREETFCNLNKSELGLAQLPCKEAGGIIWVILDRHAKADFSYVEPQLVTDFEALGIPTAHVYGRKTFEVKANWKLVMEAFLEGYHVQRLHAKTVGPFFADITSAVTRIGNHIRTVSGKVDFSPEKLAENIHKSVTQTYRIFPNGIMITSPYYISLMMINPTSVGTTKVDYHMLTQGPPDSPKAEEVYSRSYEMILKVFGEEDFWAAEICYEGMASGAITETRYCGLEDKIPLYYEILESHL